ncbi:DUF2851 family protein [Flavobacterium procerum]|uniref:DUF2851 family protein n=1 Tax=Flavobacterium procerum TaxID=1455569 RepID=UPI0035E5B520
MKLKKLKTTENEELIILHSGDFLENFCPDFLMHKIIIGNQKWAGNVEIHVKSSIGTVIFMKETSL